MTGQRADGSGAMMGWSRASAALVLCAVCVLGVSTSSCGYALAGRGSFLPGYIRTIGVPTFVNRTTVFNLESLLTQRVRAEFIGRGKYQIVPQATGVDALLTGEVTAVTVTPASFTAQQLATRYTVAITARVELRDMRENKVLWENPSITFRQEYEATGSRDATNPGAFLQQDLNTLERMSTEFARTIVSAILEAF